MQTYEDGDTVTYQYDNSGALATVTDSATGQPLTMTLSEDVYYYVLNLQGDVTGIVDGSGTLMINYSC